MKTGDRVLSRYTVTAEAPAEDRVRRFRAVDDDGTVVELLALRTTSETDSDAEARFKGLHRGVATQRDPALVRVRAVTTDPTGRTIVVRDPTDDATLADLDVDGLHPRTVAAIGARLIPALLAVGTALDGPLLASDLGIDRDGLPVLAPRGRPVIYDVDSRRHLAPEVAAGGPVERTSALFGLGVVLHHLATGRYPALAPGGTAPPASTWRPDLPPGLDRALALLLSPDPALRPGALPLLQDASGPLSDLRPKLAAKRGYEPVVYTTVGPARGAGGQPDRREDEIGAVIVLRAAALAALDPRSRSAAAGYADVPESVVRGHAEQGRPLLFEAHAKAADARARAKALAAESGLPLEVLTGWGQPPRRLAGCAVSGAAATLGVAALAAGVLWAPAFVIAAVLAVTSALGAVMALAPGNDAFDQAAQEARARRAHLAPPDVRRVSARIASLRRRIHTATLPDAASADLREDLRTLEEQVEALSAIAAIADQTLATTDLIGQRSHLTRLTAEASARPELAPQRDRAARMVADLEDVASRRQRALDELARMQDALDTLDGAFASTALAEQVAEGAQALDRLTRRTRLAREALADTDAPKPPRTRELE